MEKYKIYLKKFKIAVYICAVALGLIVFFIYKTVPVVQKIIQIQEQHKSQSALLSDAERKLENLKAEQKRRKIEEEQVVKELFKPVNLGLDTEAAINDEFSEILQLIRENKIKTRSVNYEYDPKDDNFVKNVPEKFQVCCITAEMIANYTDFENFLRDLYKHKHFLDICKIEILPYEKNKRILLISLQMKLYAQRDPSTYMPASDASADKSKDEKSETSKIPSPQKVDGGISPEATQ